MNADPVIDIPHVDTVANRLVEPRQPGALHGEVWLTLQTYQAVNLVHGRAPSADKPAIIGLVGFADRLRVIWHAARHDDPYADWWLIKVHEEVQLVNEGIEAYQTAITEQLNQLASMDVSVASSERPTRVRLQFANPYAYQAARLLAHYDRLVCALATVAHVGLLDPERRQQILRECAHKLRGLFMVPQGYRFLKLDRATFRERAGRSHEARQIMGELPEDILRGERRPSLAPRKRAFPTAISGPMPPRPTSYSAAGRPDEKNCDG